MPELLPLDKVNRVRIARAFKDVPRVDMAIDCVIEGQMGTAIVDSAQSPTAFRLHLGSFTYFAGDATSPGGRSLLEGLGPYTFLMPSAPGWFEATKSLYKHRLGFTGRELQIWNRGQQLKKSLSESFSGRKKRGSCRGCRLILSFMLQR